MDSRLESKLLKLLALSKRGRGGEQDNASKMLNDMLAKNNLSINDLIDESIDTYWIKWGKGDLNKDLLMQTVYRVCGNSVTMGTNGNQRGKIGIETTKGKFIEIEVLFDLYCVALDKEMNLLYHAFIHKNRIYGPSDKDSKYKEPTKEDIEDMVKIKLRMENMDLVQTTKRIG